MIEKNQKGHIKYINKGEIIIKSYMNKKAQRRHHSHRFLNFCIAKNRNNRDDWRLTFKLHAFHTLGGQSIVYLFRSILSKIYNKRIPHVLIWHLSIVNYCNYNITQCNALLSKGDTLLRSWCVHYGETSMCNQRTL